MNMAKQLHEIREQQKAIVLMMERSEYLRATLYGRAIRYDGDKVQQSAADMMCARLTEVCDRDARIRKRQKRLDRRKDQIRQLMRQLPDDHARVLDLYYLATKPNGRLLSWREVSIIVGASERHVMRLSAEGVEKMNEITYIY